MDMIKDGVGHLGAVLTANMPDGHLRSLLVEGIIGGAGSVLVFLPQILILFFFILVLEDCGYLPRAAFAGPPDGRRGPVGPRLHPAAVQLCLRHSRRDGGAHHPEPARPPGDHHDRAADDLLGAPAGVCADHRRLHSRAPGVGLLSLQGLVLFILYLAGIISAMAVAWVMKRGMGVPATSR
jgi:ferrous iron transport protein B